MTVNEKTIRELLKYPNVVGVSRRIQKRIRKGVVVDEDVVRVYVEKKLPLSQLKPEEVIPLEVEIDVEGKKKKIGTDVVEIGRLRALQTLDPRKKYRPIPAGVSTSRLVDGGTGTIGWYVYDEDGELYMISNHHVWVYPTNQGSRGDKLIQPGNVDGGGENDVFGELFDFIPISRTEYNYVDLALAKPYDYSQVYLSILNIGGITGYRDVKQNETIYKHGRTTGLTAGVVIDDSALVEVYYDGSVYFDDVFIVQGVNVASAGDSGSPIFTSDYKFTGLLFAGSGTTIYVGCKVSRILEALRNKIGKKFFPAYGNAPLPFCEKKKFKWCIHLLWKLWLCLSHQ